MKVPAGRRVVVPVQNRRKRLGDSLTRTGRLILRMLIRVKLRLSCSPDLQDISPAPEDHRTRFYEGYRKVAEEYDKGFLKKHDEDLNTTLIFVGTSSRPQVLQIAL